MHNGSELKAWRKQRRLAFIAQRLGLEEERRREWDGRIERLLNAAFALPQGMVVGFCWPYKGEFDARRTIRRMREMGARAALPAVVDKKGPLQFSEWWPGVAMAPGVYEIPVPQGTSVVHPDAVIIPMNAFDEQGYRLGYGGGYFDRTLAALQPKPIAIGIGYEMFRVGTIHPCEHDIPMDFIITEKGIHAMEEGRLRRIDAAACTERVTRLSAARRLPRAQPVGSAP